MAPLIGIIMGSTSDWETMSHAARTLDGLAIPYEARVMSAHRTPALVDEYMTTAESRGLEVIIAGAGGAAHLAGVAAAKTLLPVLGVPIQSKALNGMDSLLSTVQMPGGIPVGTLAIGNSGAVNAALLAAAILANKYPEIRKAIRTFRETQRQAVLARTHLPQQTGSNEGVKPQYATPHPPLPRPDGRARGAPGGAIREETIHARQPPIQTPPRARRQRPSQPDESLHREVGQRRADPCSARVVGVPALPIR